jgi:hypothetical protein
MPEAGLSAEAASHRRLNIFFDVDYTIISAYGILRPGVRECFQRLIDEGHVLHIWSGVGLRWHEVRANKLESLIAGVYLKPTGNYMEEWKRQGVPVQPDFIVDDHQEIVQVFGGIVVRPYFYPDDRDQEMEAIYQAIHSYAETGRTLHPHFWPPRNGHH